MTAPVSQLRAAAEVRLKEAEDVMREVIGGAEGDHPGRKVWKSSASEGITLWYETAPDLTPFARFVCVGRIPMSADQVVPRVLLAPQHREKINPSWLSTDVLEQWEDEGGARRKDVTHECLKGALGGLISGRDFVQARQTFSDKGPDGVSRHWLVYQSMDEQSSATVALPQGMTRAKTFPSGSVVVPLTDAESLLTTVLHVDVGGSIPVWLGNKGAASELHTFFTLIRDVSNL